MEGKAQVFDFALLLHLLQKFHAVQVLYLFIVVAVEAVYQIEIDVVSLQGFELIVEASFHVLFVAAQPDAHFICDQIAVPRIRLKRLAKDFFRFSLVVDHRGVEIVDAHFVRFSQQLHRCIHVHLIAVFRKTHSSVTQTGDFLSQSRNHSAIDHFLSSPSHGPIPVRATGILYFYTTTKTLLCKTPSVKLFKSLSYSH